VVTSHETAGGAQSPVVTAIHVDPGSRLPMRAVESVHVEAGLGIVGDRYHGTVCRALSSGSIAVGDVVAHTPIPRSPAC
jgi:hypothetical protein